MDKKSQHENILKLAPQRSEVNFNLEKNAIIKNLNRVLDFEICCRLGWGSRTSDHRLQIRTGICDLFTDLTAEEIVQVLNLEFRPKVTGHFISISHCEIMGGFAIADHNIGFDVIEISRLSPQSIGRISSSKEMQNCPDPRFLWPAKEAVFKLADGKYQVLSEIETSGWSEIQSGLFRFQNSAFVGYVFTKQNLLFSVCFNA